MTPQEALTRVIEHREIFREEMLSLMRSIMSGQVSPTLIAAIIIGLRVKKETIGEIAAAAEVMLRGRPIRREMSLNWKDHPLGPDGMGTRSRKGG